MGWEHLDSSIRSELHSLRCLGNGTGVWKIGSFEILITFTTNEKIFLPAVVLVPSRAIGPYLS